MAPRRNPISVTEFIKGIGVSSCSNWRHGIGLCISGGPDSMALAALFSKVHKLNHKLPGGKRSTTPPLSKIQAFIVDHQARERSAEEARIVADRLESLGLPTEILQIQWPIGINPMHLTNFETRARIERYRLLARAAIRHNLGQLYLGHHQDDQVENFLMRLTRSDNGTKELTINTLLGMRSVAPIPCCHDIYGASDAEPSSGYAIEASVHLARVGLSLVRPFLKYPKARLRATCESMGVPFVVDETNFQPTTTRRNAIRHLFANYRLPRAIKHSSLIGLQRRLVRKALYFKDSHLAPLWNLIKISRFDLRSGLLSVQLPESLDSSCEESLASVAYVLEGLVDAVSPMSRGSVSVPPEILKHICKPLTRSSSDVESPQINTTITVAGVLIKSSLGTLQLCRQPVRRDEPSELTKTFATDMRAPSVDGWSWSEWLFWDNRYWLRCKLNTLETASEFSVRAYTEADVAPIKARLRKSSTTLLHAFENALKDAAPGKIKFTLPVISKGGLLVAFPTLDIIVPDLSGRVWSGVSSAGKPWQVRFKRQTPEVRRSWSKANPNPSLPEPIASEDGSNREVLASQWPTQLLDPESKSRDEGLVRA